MLYDYRNALVLHRTVLHDLLPLAIHRTTQINSRPTEISLLYIFGSEVAICVGDKIY